MKDKGRYSFVFHCLGVSGEKVEIDPVSSKSKTILLRQKAVTYDADRIASCDILEDRGAGNSKLLYP